MLTLQFGSCVFQLRYTACTNVQSLAEAACVVWLMPTQLCRRVWICIFTLLYRCHLQLQLLAYLSLREIPLPGWLLKYHLFWAVSMTIWQCRLPLSFLPDPQWRLCVLKSLLPDCALKCYLLRGKTKQNAHGKKNKNKISTNLSIMLIWLDPFSIRVPSYNVKGLQRFYIGSLEHG